MDAGPLRIERLGNREPQARVSTYGIVLLAMLEIALSAPAVV
jgi:hypothetical protein